PSVTVASAGLQTVSGRPAEPMAILVAAGYGLDLTAHASTPLDAGLVDWSDVILVMEVAQLMRLRRRFPAAREKTFLLTTLAPGTPLEVRDPLNGDESIFEACFAHIAAAIEPIAAAIGAAQEQR